MAGLTPEVARNILNVKAKQKGMSADQYLAAIGCTEADWLADPQKYMNVAVNAPAPSAPAETPATPPPAASVPTSVASAVFPGPTTAPATAPSPAPAVPTTASGAGDLAAAITLLRNLGVKSITF